MPELNAQNGDAACIKLATVFGHFRKMAEFATANETPSSSQNFIEVEIVSDEEFEMLDEAIRIAINMKGKIYSCCQYKVKSLFCVRLPDNRYHIFWICYGWRCTCKGLGRGWVSIVL